MNKQLKVLIFNYSTKCVQPQPLRTLIWMRLWFYFAPGLFQILGDLFKNEIENWSSNWNLKWKVKNKNLIKNSKSKLQIKIANRNYRSKLNMEIENHNWKSKLKIEIKNWKLIDNWIWNWRFDRRH